MLINDNKTHTVDPFSCQCDESQIKSTCLFNISEQNKHSLSAKQSFPYSTVISSKMSRWSSFCIYLLHSVSYDWMFTIWATLLLFIHNPFISLTCTFHMFNKCYVSLVNDMTPTLMIEWFYSRLCNILLVWHKTKYFYWFTSLPNI